jgi:hypothetical protein
MPSILPLTSASALRRNILTRPLVFLPAVLLLLSAVLAGCGGGDEKSKIVLATVGPAEIKADYYENRLSKLTKDELPRAADGSPLNMAAREGKMAFLKTLINKETMVQTAEKMGYLNDPGISKARESLLAYEAGLEMWNRVIQEPANTITEEELQAFYEKMGSSRRCQYVITNFIEDAEAARKDALEGMDWDDVVDKYHDGQSPPDGVFEISVPFGRYKPEFETGVFETEIGGITPPLKSVYGYWVMKVIEEKEGKKPILEEAKAQILDITRSRKTSYRRDEYAAKVREKFQFTLNEEALFKAYQGLPEDESIFLPGTQTPIPQEELAPLDIAVEDLDMPFYSFMTPDGIEESTLGDYKAIYDRMSVFQRPKRSELMGGMGGKITAELDRSIFYLQAKDMGLLEDPVVVDKVDIKIEEMMLNKLYAEAVVFDETVTPEQVDEYWAEHGDDFYAQESRDGRLVVCLNPVQAEKARAAALEGTPWSDILLQFGSNRDNKAKSGRLEEIHLSEGSPVAEALFALDVDQVSQPFAMADGKTGVVMLEAVTPGRPAELSEVREMIGQNIRAKRKEAAFEALLDEWKADLEIVLHEENLDKVASWEELTAVEIPENVVPRN